MVSDQQIVERIGELLANADLTTTTTSAIRRQLEQDLHIDLSDRKAFVRQQVDLYLQSHPQNQQEEENAARDEPAHDDGAEEALKAEDDAVQEDENEDVEEEDGEEEDEDEEEEEKKPEQDSKRLQAKIDRAKRDRLETIPLYFLLVTVAQFFCLNYLILGVIRIHFTIFWYFVLPIMRVILAAAGRQEV